MKEQREGFENRVELGYFMAFFFKGNRIWQHFAGRQSMVVVEAISFAALHFVKTIFVSEIGESESQNLKIAFSHS